MALACSCGAGSPIVVPDLQREVADSPVLPASLSVVVAVHNILQRHSVEAVTAAIGREPRLPHLEVYLGYSAFSCPAKTAWEKRLRELGCVSFAECPDERCQEEPARFYERERRRAPDTLGYDLDGLGRWIIR